MGKHLFVTVGTTKFEKLISTISNEETLKILLKLGFTSIKLQTGRGKYTPISHDRIKIEYVEYIEDFQKEIHQSDLIISHAGAGTCLEVLQIGKPLLVVINDDLMDNHQIELATHLSKKGYLYHCTCDKLKEALKKDFEALTIYPKAPNKIFSDYLDNCMGF